MSIRRAPRPDAGWFLVRNDVARDARLSPKARGILFYMLSFPDNWRLDHRTIARANDVGRDYVLSALKELRAHGYLVQERRRGDKGHWVTDTTLHDTPQPTTEPGPPAEPPQKPQERRPRPLKSVRADQLLNLLAEEHGGLERVTDCLRHCHGAKGPGSWLLDLDNRGQLDGFLSARGLGDTCCQCNDTHEENAS